MLKVRGEVRGMKARSHLVRLLLALSLGALLLAGLTVGTPIDAAEPPPTAATQVEADTDAVVEDDVLFVATKQRHVRIRALRWYGIPFWGPAHFITVDVNPTLRGRKSYTVILKVRHKGEWIRCAKGRTTNRDFFPVATIGKAPHEMVFFDACKKKAPKKYRVIVRAQHGFLRTVTTVQPVQF